MRVALVALLLSAGCIVPVAPKQSAVRTPVALALVHQDPRIGWSTEVPEAFRAAQHDALSQRNLVVAPSVLSNVAANELTDARLSAMASASASASSEASMLLCLVETASRYDSQLVGRYRWTVFAKITVADSKNLSRSTSRSIDVPITLKYGHEEGNDALALAADPIARELGVVVDSFLASYQAKSSLATAVGAPSSAAPPYSALYFVLVDRFANGDPKNDGAVDTGDPAAWHGGDIAGVTQHLDHIAALGFTDIWLSPITSTRDEKFDGHGAFHGYWTESLDHINTRFGSESELRELGQAAKRRGIGLVLDLVLNHVGPNTTLTETKPSWFHPSAPISNWNDARELEQGEVHGLPDLDQNNSDVFAYLAAATKKWAAVPGVRGFRLDAVRHIGAPFWRRFVSELRETRSDIALLGEVFDGNPAALARGFELGFDQLFDFPLHYASIDSVCRRRSLRDLAAALGSDRVYRDASRLVTFADNHDTPRAASQCSKDDLATLFFFLLSIRGTPAITYGTEAGLRGAKEPENRADMRFETTSIGALIGKLLATRRAHPSLRSPVRRIRVAETRALVWEQQAGDETALIGISQKDRPLRIEVVGTAVVEHGFVACGPHCLELPANARGLAWLPSAAPFRRSTSVVEIEVKGAPSGKLVIVGNIPELGVWDPQRGARTTNSRARLELPVGDAFAFKLAVLDPKNPAASQFESGANRNYLVIDKPKGTASDRARLEITWRK